MSTSALRLRPPQRQTLAEGVTAALRNAIYGGRFRPGDRLPQANIAQELGVSQAPVREALTMLEREGLVERTVNQGATIIALSNADIEEIGALRAALEVLAVKLAIRHATEDDFKKLTANIRSTEKATTPTEAARLDLEFHELLMIAAKNGRLLQSWRSLVAPLRLAMTQLNNRNPKTVQAGTVRGHGELLELIRAKDEAAAVAHTEQAMDWLPQMLLEADDGASENAAPRPRERSL
jgi:DNA-binding GntR family transcriptional regulator